MDPLSLTASIIALGTAVNATAKGVSKLLALKTAPKRMIDVHNQLEEIRVLVGLTLGAAQSSSITEPNIVHRFTVLVERATAAVNNADSFLRKKLVKNADSLDDENAKIEIKKLAFLKSEAKLNEIVDELKYIQQSLFIALGCITSVKTQRMALKLDRIDLFITESRGPSHQLPQGEGSRVEEILGDDSTLLGAAFADNDATPTLEDLDQIDGPHAHTGSVRLPSQEVLPLPSPESYCALEATVMIENSHINICGCPCHSPMTLQSPNWLVNAVGTLLAKWYRDQEPCLRCSQRSCKTSKTSLLRTRYYFPWWLCRRFVEFESAWTASQKLVSSLKFQATIPNDSQVFLLAQHNNIEGMKRLFELKLATPFDVSESGRTPLHFAASAVKAEMIEFLVKQGAETDAEDRSHFTPHDIIWELYLRNPGKRGHFLTAGGLSSGDTASLEKQLFSPIHQIVLGIGPFLDLDTYLKMDSREIDAQDYSGKTPLSWAAQRKNTSMVQILLKHKASVKIPDHRGKTPLHLAAGSGTPEAVELILKAIDSMEEALEDPSKSLIHAQDEKNRTPLNYATRGDLYRHAQLLIQYGADLEAVEADTDRSILLNAIYRNSHKVVPLLLNRGARTDVRDAHGATILHHIGKFGSLETMRAFSGYRLGPVDPSATDSVGLTPIEAFNSPDARCNPDNVADRPEALQLFRSILINTIQLTESHQIESHTDSGLDLINVSDNDV